MVKGKNIPLPNLLYFLYKVKKKAYLPIILLVINGLFYCCSDSKSDTSKATPKTPITLASSEKVDFNFDVRPILVQKCYLCHGPDVSSRKANLRLDTYEGATAVLEENRRAVVPGQPDKSELVARINSTDPDLIMPSPDSHLTLSTKEKDVLTAWIQQGAEYKPHWAFIPPKVVATTRNTEDEIDFLVNEQIKKSGLTPAPAASRNSLIRRVSYLLTGLPPTPEAIQKFVSDQSPDAYEKMVDGYLSSKAYGERWARHWMDIVRYAETKGHEFDYSITGAWRYRDYLIRAFNSDLPYNQLVREHLAGDLLKTVRRNPTDGAEESRLGTAFFTLGEGTHSPVDVRKDEADRIDNMVDVTSKAFLGLTVSCARCHDHKFDPISAADYYAMYGIMESTRFSPLPTGQTAQKKKNIEEIIQLKEYIKKEIASQWYGAPQAGNQITPPATSTPDTAGKSGQYIVLGDFRENSFNGWKSDGNAFGTKTTLGNPVFDKESKELVALEDGKASSMTFGTGVFGALRSPNFVIDKDFIGVKALGKNGCIRLIIDNFQLISFPIYGDMDKRVTIDNWHNFEFNVTLWKGHKAYIEFLPGFFEAHVYRLPPDAFIEVQYAIAYNNKWPEAVNTLATKPASTKTALQNWVAGKASSSEVGHLNELIKSNGVSRKLPQLEAALAKRDQLKSNLIDSTYVNAVTEGFGINSPVFVRGNHQQLSKERVPRRFLSALSKKNKSFQTGGSGRLELAEAIVDPENPLTSRIMVNRIWHYLFGRGIVETVDNFGLQGKLPSHPELLDYLAIQYQKDGWSTRRLIRSIVLSKTFRRSVTSDSKTEKTDPDNIYLARFPRRRIEAEVIRDGILATAGDLNLTLYGPPVPVHVTSFMQGRGRPGTSGPLDGNKRRSIYQEVRRNFLDPMMTTFDRPTPFTTFGKRNVTNVPAQSLILMNDPFVIDQSERMASNLLRYKKLTLDARIQWIYLRAFARQATPVEVEKAKGFITILAKTHKVNDKNVMTDLRVWKDYCHSIFNLKEFIYLI